MAQAISDGAVAKSKASAHPNAVWMKSYEGKHFWSVTKDARFTPLITMIYGTTFHGESLHSQMTS
jgi:hypothetical protein